MVCFDGVGWPHHAPQLSETTVIRGNQHRDISVGVSEWVVYASASIRPGLIDASSRTWSRWEESEKTNERKRLGRLSESAAWQRLTQVEGRCVQSGRLLGRLR